MGDIAGNGDDEVILLRQVPSAYGSGHACLCATTAMTIRIGEPTLDADNGYQAGVAGDTDGDGRDECRDAKQQDSHI